MHLTEERVAALPAKAKVYDVWDAGGRGAVRGLCVQVLPSGTKTYRYSFRFKGAAQAISYKLGRWPGLSLGEARAKAAAAEKVVAKGQDPRVADPANSDAFATTVDEWYTLEQVGRLKNKSADEAKQFVQRLCKTLEHRPVGEITYRDVETLLAKVRDVAKTPATAIRLHAHLKTFFRWCARTQRIEKSPIADMPSPAPEPKPRERDWFKRDAADPVITKLWAFASELSTPLGSGAKAPGQKGASGGSGDRSKKGPSRGPSCFSRGDDGGKRSGYDAAISPVSGSIASGIGMSPVSFMALRRRPRACLYR